MSDYLPSEAYLAKSWCRGCEPDRDPFAEILEERLCRHHAPTWKGLDDDAITTTFTLNGRAEAGRASARAFCNLIHRGEALAEPLPSPPEPPAAEAEGIEWWD